MQKQKIIRIAWNLTPIERPNRKNKKREVTSIDVAKLAGVSQPTVSRVFNKGWTTKLRGDTRERVLKAAEELCYIPSAIAQIMTSRHFWYYWHSGIKNI